MSVNVKNAAQAATLGNIKKLDGKAKKTASVRVPEYLSKSGSIFNAPETAQITKTQTTESKKINSSIFNNTNNLNFITSNGNKNQKTQKSGFKYSGKNGLTACLDENLSKDLEQSSNISTSAKLNTARTGISTVRSDVGKLQQSGNTVKSYADKSVSLKKNIETQENNYKKTLEKQNKELENLEKERNALIVEIQRNQQEVSQLNRELENELASTNPNQDKIANCRSQINSKSSTITYAGNKIYIVTRSSQNLVNQMNNASKAYYAQSNSTQNALQAQQSAAEKVIETATTVKVGAQVLSSLGEFLVLAAHSATLASLGLSAAFTETLAMVGETAKTVGQWGSCAADAVNTVAYASEGKIGMALCSAASAVAMGASAIDSTKATSAAWKAKNAASDAAKKGAEAAADKAVQTAQQATESNTTKAVKEVAKGVEQLGQQINSLEGNGNTQTPANANGTKPKTAEQLAKEEQARQNAQLALNRYGHRQYSFA